MGAETEILIGPSGSGKSKICYEALVDAAWKHPEQQYYLIVPEQAGSSMEQRILSINRERTGREGFFNIDIIGFSRLAYRVFEEQGRSMRRVLEDYGKMILLRSVLADVRDRLQYYGGSVDRQGFVEELKSLFSEFLLFDICPEDLEKAAADLAGQAGPLKHKLSDVEIIYRAFREHPIFRDDYMVAEELPACLARLLSEPGEIKAVDGSICLFDGFTGFTAEQRKVIAGLLPRVKKLRFTITMDPDKPEDPLFSQSKEMLDQLQALASGAKLLTQPAPAPDTAIRHLSAHVFRFPVREYTKAVGQELRIWKTLNPMEELRVVAEDIRDRVLRGELRYRDTAILSADLADLGSYADSIMQEYGLPYFADYTRGFMNNPIIDAQMAILEILDRDFTYESVFAFLKTGILNHAMEELGLEPDSIEYLENFVLAHGIRGKKLWKKKTEHFSRKDRRTESEEMLLSCTEEIRQLFLSVLKPVLRFTGRKPFAVGDMIKGLKQIAEDPRLAPELLEAEAASELSAMGYPAEARSYSGLQEKYITLLEKTEAILGDQQMLIHDLRETLLMGVREIQVGVIPPTLDSVLVGDLERTRISGVKALYIVNMNEGILPRAAGQGRILSDRDRELLGQAMKDKTLAPDEAEKRFREQFSLYLAMSRPSQCLTLSYSMGSRSGAELEPSFLLGRVRRLFPKMRDELKVRKILSGNERTDRMEYLDLLRRSGERNLTEEEQEQARIFAALFTDIPRENPVEEQGKEHLPEELMKELPVAVSVTKLERYARCPYAYFLNYILRLYPRREHEVKSAEVGSILHRALELVFRTVKLRHGNAWRELSEDTLKELVRQAVTDAVGEVKPELQEEELQDGKTGMILQQMEELTERSVEVLQSQLCESSMLPEIIEGSFEAGFEAERPDRRKEDIRILGTVDRMDLYRSPEDGSEFIRILDYKTWDLELDPRDVRDGRDIQLPLYLRILTEIRSKDGTTCIPAGMYYYYLNQPTLKTLSKDQPEEEAVRTAAEDQLKLRGIPNVSPMEDEESELPVHFIAELQETGIVDESGKLSRAHILPIKFDRSHAISASTILATTDDMNGLGDYSLYKAKELTERILGGRIEKYPARKAGTADEHRECARCNAAAVCRFRKDLSPEHYIPKEDSPSELVEQLAELGRNADVPLTRAFMREKTEEELLSEEREENDEEME